MRRVTVSLTEDVYETLRKAKENRNVTISSIVRKALREYITRYNSITEKCVETKRIKICG